MMSTSSIIVDKIHSTVRIDNPTHVINLSEQVIKVEMSPFEWSHNLICIAHSDEIVIGIVKFQEEDEEIEDEIEFEVIKSFKIEKRVHSLAWCPETSLNIIPKSIVFACGTANHINIYCSNLADKTKMQELKGHSSYVNSLAYEPSGDLLASTSDDLTCRLWAVKEGSACVTVFVLKSPGVSVCWHNADPGKLLVAEKSGTVRLYNVERQQAILSLDTSLVPLTAADWSPVNCFQVAALASGHLVIWDITRSSRPVDVRMVHPSGGSLLRYSHQSEYHIASVGQPDNSLKVTHVNMKHPICNATMTTTCDAFPPDGYPHPSYGTPPSPRFGGSPFGGPLYGGPAFGGLPPPQYGFREKDSSSSEDNDRVHGPPRIAYPIRTTAPGPPQGPTTRTMSMHRVTVTRTYTNNRADGYAQVPNGDQQNPAAAAAGVAGEPLANMRTGSPSPPPTSQTSRTLPPPTPANPVITQASANDDKCNWCIRRTCNPGGCQDFPNFNQQQDATTLHSAITSKNEAEVIKILTNRSEKQIKRIQEAYQSTYSTLAKDIKESNFKSKKLLMALLKKRVDFYVDQLHTALQKDDKETMISILTSLSPCAIQKIGVAYYAKYEKYTLDTSIEMTNKLKFEDFLVNLGSGGRDPDSAVDDVQAQRDAEILHNSDPGKWVGPDDNAFAEIFTKRSYSQLREIIKKYNEMSSTTNSNIESDIRDKANGNIRDGLLVLLRNIQDQPTYFADELEASMEVSTRSGVLGYKFKDEDKLVRIIRGRCGIDLGDITNAYPKNHNGEQLSAKFVKQKNLDYMYKDALERMIPKSGEKSKSDNSKGQTNAQVKN